MMTRVGDTSMISKIRCFFGYVLDVMISVYMLMVIVVMPFYFTSGYAHIGTDKSVFFRKLSVNAAKWILPTVAIYLILLAVEKGYFARLWKCCRKNLSVTDLCALVYGASVILSYLCSDYKENALWGADSWWMGLIPQLILVAIYFFISRFWEPKKWMFMLFLPVSAIVFLLAYLNRFGIYPIEMEPIHSSFISTIGNINWYCGYLVSVFFAGCYLLWERKSVLLTAYVLIGFATLVTQGSASGILALTVVLLVMFILSASDGYKMQTFWLEVLLFSVASLVTLGIRVAFPDSITTTKGIVKLLTYSIFPVLVFAVACSFLIVSICVNRTGAYADSLLRKIYEKLAKIIGIGAVTTTCIVIGMIVLNTLRPGSLGKLSEIPFFTFNPDWGSNRGATWMAGWRCFTQQDALHKLVGVGPDSMAQFLYRDSEPLLVDMVRRQFGMNNLINAHGEWLTILVNIGVLGCASFIGMMISAIVRFLRRNESPIIGACGLCLLAYTANNWFSFQQSMNVATIFVILGIGEAFMRELKNTCHLREGVL